LWDIFNLSFDAMEKDRQLPNAEKTTKPASIARCRLHKPRFL